MHACIHAVNVMTVMASRSVLQEGICVDVVIADLGIALRAGVMPLGNAMAQYELAIPLERAGDCFTQVTPNVNLNVHC